MFCGECGSKNKEGASFCKECGAKLGQQKKVESNTKTTKENKNNGNFKEFVKKNKVPVIIVCLLVVVIAAYFIINSTVYGPKQFVLKYAKAEISGDVAKQIEYAGVYGESDFITKDVVAKKYKDTKLKNIEQIRVLSDSEVKKLATNDVESTIGKLFGSSDLTKNINTSNTNTSSLTKSYVVEYITEGSSSSKYLTVLITKANKKNMGIFDNWKALGNNVISNNVKLEAKKDSVITVDGVKVTDKYLNKDESSTSYNVYDLGKVLKKDVEVSVVLKNGIELSKKVDTYDDKKIDVTSSYSLDVNDSSKKKIADKFKSFVNNYVVSAIKNEDFQTMKSKLEISDSLNNNSAFESNYNSLVSKYDNDKIESFNVQSVDISSVYIGSDYVRVYGKVKYDYKYADDATVYTKSGTKTSSFTIEFDMNSSKLLVKDYYTSSFRYLF